MEKIQAFIFSYDGLLLLKKEKDDSINFFSTKEDIQALSTIFTAKSFCQPRIADDGKDIPSVIDMLEPFQNGELQCVVIPLEYDSLRDVYYKSRDALSFAHVYAVDLKTAVEKEQSVMLGKYKQGAKYTLEDRLIYKLGDVFKPWLESISKSQNNFVQMYTGLTLDDAKKLAHDNKFTISTAQVDRKGYGRTCVWISNNLDVVVFDGIVVDCKQG